jgi:hypothetical protein
LGFNVLDWEFFSTEVGIRIRNPKPEMRNLR